jgi:hypothetical protein
MKIQLSDTDRQSLEKWTKSRATAAKVKLRARIVLMTADGISTQAL